MPNNFMNDEYVYQHTFHIQLLQWKW